MKAAQFDLEVNGVRLGGHSWLPDEKATAAMVIEHGMAEHGARYARFAEAMVAAGVAVFAVDMRGHKLTAGAPRKAGHVADRGGWPLLVDDLRAVVRHVRFLHPDVPLVLLAHSAGTLVARELVTQPPLLVDGLVLSAPVGHPGARGAAGVGLARGIARVRGADHRSALLDRLSFGAFNAAFKPARTDFDWLSGVPEEVDAYVADEWCGFICSAAWFRDMASATMRVNSPEMAARTPSDLPILVLSGSDDPVTASGVSAQRIATDYEAAGVRNVRVSIVAGGRHELLHDVMADQVTGEIADFVRSLG